MDDWCCEVIMVGERSGLSWDLENYLSPPPDISMDKTTSTILITVAVVLCLAIGGLALLGADYDDDNNNGNTTTENTHYGEYSYKITGINAYPTHSGHIQLPKNGQQFVEADISITAFKTVGYVSFAYNFNLICDGTPYEKKTSNDNIYSVEKGKTENIKVIYEIPASFRNLSLKWVSEDFDLTNKTGNVTSIGKKIVVEESIKWDYKFIEDVTSFPNAMMQGHITTTAATGNHFIVLKVIEKNVSYDGGDYQPSPTHIKLVGSDGITYDYSSKTHSYSDDNIGLYNITLGKNTSKTYHIVFEVPSTTSLSKVIYASGYAKYIAGQDESLLS